MDFLIDVHLPVSLSKFLAKESGCSSVHVNQILQKWHTADSKICKYADQKDLVLITKDNDFKNSHFVNKTPKKLIRVTLGNITNAEILFLFAKYLPFITPLSSKSGFYIEVGKDQIIVID